MTRPAGEFASTEWLGVVNEAKGHEMPMDCNLDGITGKGRCCCNCRHQMLAMKHPWNEGKAQGRITEIFGALCAVPDMLSPEGRRQAVFFDTGHGMCEMHEFRTPNVEVTCPPRAGHRSNDEHD